MAKYELLERSFINQMLLDPGAVVEVSDDVVPGPHMKPVDAAAKAAFKKTGYTVGAVTEHEIVDSIASFGASPAGIKAGMNASG
jgi:hypothetical protein